MGDLQSLRLKMVQSHLERRGIADSRVLEAFRTVRREEFLPEGLAEFAYDDAPLPLSEGQTISQPYIVAVTAEALGLRGDERVLEVGTGSGYAAAILGRIAQAVYSIERVPSLASSAEARLERLGFANVHVRCGDGTLGWPEHAPYGAIAVAAGGPKAPPALLEQLAVGGRLVMPIGADEGSQILTRITRLDDTRYSSEELMGVRFVPLIGEHGFGADEAKVVRPAPKAREQHAVAALVRESAEPIDNIETTPLEAMLDRVADARVVLIGEATHGTSEFYRMRTRITRELIARRGFTFVAVEADWPDAARINDYVLGGKRRSAHDFVPFERFPRWMWRNHETHDFVDWLSAFNREHNEQKVGFHGLDLYSMFTSMAAVLHYLDGVDPAAAAVARRRYGTLTPWQRDPAAYGEAVLTGRYRSSETAAVAMLEDLLARRLDYARNDGDRFFDAAQNARVVAAAEAYYREMYYGSVASWNLRDSHMFGTLRSLLGFYGPASKGIVWAHNSHIGDAAATEMGVRGEHNIGQLCRALLGERSYRIGFGTDHGTVMAATDWDGPMQAMQVRPSLSNSYEWVCHQARVPAFALHLRAPVRAALRDELMVPRLERAIGVIYRPETERQSHYFDAMLPQQFDEYVWFDETHALGPLEGPRPVMGKDELPDTYPFGL